MVKPANCKVWNEDLILACQSRYEMCVRNEQRQQYIWREGAVQIRAARGDIYTFATGRVVNLPQNLKKTVHNLCMDIIQGRKNVLPDGYAAVTQQEALPGNPFERHPYLKKIKARGGAYAILMAFHHSQSKTLTKDQICNAAQPYCDEDMRENYLAGRTYGAWKSKDTLERHLLLTKQGGRARYVDGVGFRRNEPDSYTLTRNGEKFIEAMLRKFPQSAAAPASASVGANGPVRAFTNNSPFVTPSRAGHAVSEKRSGSNLEEGDEEKLRDWVLSAKLNETIDFKVGKARRKHLHDLCHALEHEFPGLRLHHSSSYETATRRVLTVKVEQTPIGMPASAKRPLFGGLLVGQSIPDSVACLPATKRARSDLPPKVAAAQAAMERQAAAQAAMEHQVMREAILESKRKATAEVNDSYEKMERLAIEESLKAARKCALSPNSIDNDNKVDLELAVMDDVSYEEMERRAIEESLKTARMFEAPPNSEDEMNAVIEESLLSANRASVKETCFSDQKPLARGMSAAKQGVTAQRELFPSDKEPIELLSDDEIPAKLFSSVRDESIVLPPSSCRTEIISLVMEDCRPTKCSPATKNHRKSPYVINLGDDDENDSQNNEVIEIVDSQDNTNIVDGVRNESQQSVIILDDSQDCIVPASPPCVFRAAFPQLYVLIDNRERNRNATPRHLRMELASLVTKGALRSVWPHNMPTGSVAEMQLVLGDFAFDIEMESSGRKRIPIAVERKRVGDLVQRSVKGDHWRQFVKMRDEYRQAIFLIENDARTAASFTAYGSQELDGWSPNDTMIDDEKSVFLFFGRALLSSQTAKFIQTRDEISSLRAVGALGIMATCSEELVRSAAKAAPASPNHELKLVDRLIAGGIPWKLAQQMGKSLGSIHHLEFLYEECASNQCRSALLAPFISESDYNGLHSTSVGWSDAIFRVFHATQTMTNTVQRSISDHKHKVEDHGLFMSALYSNKSLDVALDAANEASDSRDPKAVRRLVSIELSDGKSHLFPTQTENSFFSLKKRDKNPMELVLPTIVMRTSAGGLSSHRLFVHLLQAKSMVSLITSGIPRHCSDYIAIAKDVANTINCDCYHRSMKNGKDRRVLLLCGLTPALDAVAKKADYMSETRVLVDLVLAHLMLAHDLVIIQAVRLNGDTELILQQLALACFHYHLLFLDDDN